MSKTDVIKPAREALLNAALGVIRAEGPQAFSLRAVAQAAGASTTLVYKYFPRKQDLAWALTERARQVLAGYLTRALGAPTPIARLRACGAEYVRFFIDHSELYRLLFVEPILGSGARFPDELEAQNAPFLIVVDRVRECMAEGAVEQGDPHRTALALWASAHGYCLLQQSGRIPAADLPGLWAEAMDHLLKGYGA